MARGWLMAALGVLGLLAGMGLVQTPEGALAHAVLLRSVPPSGQTLAGAPAEIRLLFSEPIDIVFSGIRVTNGAGQVVDRGDTKVDPSDEHQLVVSLRPALPDGLYTVAWRSLSTIDVHPDEGQYVLFVGVPVSAGASRPSDGQQIVSATSETTLGRWWFYLAASVFAGVLAAWKLVVGPVVADGRADVRATLYRHVYRLTILGGILLVIGTLFTAVAQAAAAAGVPLQAGIGQPLADLLLHGRFAAIWWPRIGLEVASLLLIAFGGLDGLAADCALATLPAVLLTSGLTSHGAALDRSIAGAGIAVDWLHILGATAWVGGLMGLLLCLPAGRREPGLLPRLLARFSRYALLASAVVLLSGVVQAVFEVGAWSALVDSAYGALVLLKAVLLLAMLALAGFNTWQGRFAVLRGQIAVVRRGVWAELAIGVVVLAIAAVLTGTPPVVR
jgi:copper transport protein